MANVYLVVGAENSGSKVVSKILLEATGGKIEDNELYLNDETNIRGFNVQSPVWDGEGTLIVHRSLPYAWEWFSVEEEIKRLMEIGHTEVVVCFRHGPVQAQAQLEHPDTTRARVISIEEANENIQLAYMSIFMSLFKTSCNFYIASYEALCYEKKAANFLLQQMGIDAKNTVKIYKSNLKHYPPR